MKNLLKKVLFILLFLFPMIAVVEAAEMEKDTLLIEAIERGESEKCLRSLIRGGAGVNGKDKDGYAPLMAAANNGKIGLVYLLLAKKAAVNDKDEFGKSALFYAEMSNYPEIIRLLSKRGADSVTYSLINGEDVISYQPQPK